MKCRLQLISTTFTLTLRSQLTQRQIFANEKMYEKFVHLIESETSPNENLFLCILNFCQIHAFTIEIKNSDADVDKRRAMNLVHIVNVARIPNRNSNEKSMKSILCHPAFS